MTIAEAETVARIAATADGECPTCVGRLFEQLNRAFPEFSWEWKDADYVDGAHIPAQVIVTTVTREAGVAP